MSIGERAVDVVLRLRWPFLALVVLLTALSAVFAQRIGVDNSVEVWFVDGDPALTGYHEFQQAFGNDEVVAIAVHDDGGVFSAAAMARIRAVGEAAAAVDGVARVTSLATVDDIRGEMDADGFPILSVGNLVGDNPDWDATRARALADPLVAGRLVSNDGKTALVVVQMATMEGFDAQRDRVLAGLRAAVAPLLGEDFRHAGIGVIYAALNQLSTVDSVVFVVASYLLIIGVLWVLMGRVLPMAVSMVTVGIGAGWLLGAYGFAGRDINMVTMILPTLVLVIGVSDCVHVMNHVAELSPSWTGTRAELVKKAAGFVFMPCLFNTVTTGVGFASLATAPMAVLRDLGVYAAVGLSVAFLLSFILCPLALLSPRFEPSLSNHGKLQRFVDGCAALALSRPLPVLAVTAILALVSMLGISRIVVDTYSLDYFREGHRVRQDSAWIEAQVGPYTPLEFVVRGPGRVDDPAILVAIDQWERAMEQDPLVAWASSAADVAKRLNRELSADGAEVVPSEPAALTQAFLLYQSSPEVDLSSQVEGDWRSARVTVGIPMLSAAEMGQLIDRLLARAKMPVGVTVTPTGYLPLYVHMMDYIVQSQLSSFGLAFVLIFGLIAALFRSLRLAALAVPANLTPILLTLGVMGFSGIRLDVATVTIGAIVLGLVVDDTVQFLYRFQHELSARGDVHEAARVTVSGVGRSLVITAIGLSLGFSVLGLAAVKSVAWFGLLVALALGTGVFGDLLVLPAMLALLPRGLVRSKDGG